MHWLMLLIILMCASTWSVFSQEDCVPASGEEPIKLGAIFPPQTIFNTSANDSFRGIQAMIEAWNACSGGTPVELVYKPAADREETITALSELRGGVPLIIGSGSSAVSEVLVESSAEGDFILWEVTEPLDQSHEFAFSPRPNTAQLARHATDYIKSDLHTLLEGEPLRIALIYESQPRARAIAEQAAKHLNLLIYREYDPRTSYRTAVQMREMDVNVMLYITLNPSTKKLRDDLLQADANLKAWVEINSAPYEPDICKVISVTTSGQVNESFRLQLGAIYTQYQQNFRDTFGKNPTPQADLAASGTYLLLHTLASPQNAITNATIEGVQQKITTTAPEVSGFWGESWQFDPDTGWNMGTVALTQQRQPEGLCTLHPDQLATCANPLMTFPTWREQARASFSCR